MDAELSEDGKIVLAKNEAERYSVRKHWKEQKAGDKLRSLTSILAGIVSVYLLISLMQARISGMNPMLERILQRNWDRAVNVYAIAYVSIVITGIWLGSKILQKITRFVMGTFSRRWTTTGILISNVIRYAAFIASIFITLQTFGVETSALITSASVLTLVFGLGSQSFVADLIAGVFLIFEGTFRVGDIVTIDGWRGEVVEIGLRATKVKNPLGNVKIFQNSRISGAINMTSDQTYAVCDVALPQGVKLEDYEQKLVSSFFPKAQAAIPDMQEPLVYEGVIAVSGASATLRISVRCLESEREQLQRELYRSLKLWLEEG